MQNKKVYIHRYLQILQNGRLALSHVSMQHIKY